jgi:hypothetical protein
MTTDDEIAALRQATREAHEALADLRREMKAAEQLRADLATTAEVSVTEQVVPFVQKGLEEFGVELKKAIDIGTEAVYARFDELGDLLLGEDKVSRRKGLRSLPQLAEEKARLNREG